MFQIKLSLSCLQRVIATMVREMAPEEKELAQLRAYSRQQTMVEERASALSLEMTSIQRSVRASLESSDVSSLDGGSSRRLSALDAAAGPRSARASEGFEEHVELFTMGEYDETVVIKATAFMFFVSVAECEYAKSCGLEIGRLCGTGGVQSWGFCLWFGWWDCDCQEILAS